MQNTSNENFIVYFPKAGTKITLKRFLCCPRVPNKLLEKKIWDTPLRKWEKGGKPQTVRPDVMKAFMQIIQKVFTTAKCYDHVNLSVLCLK